MSSARSPEQRRRQQASPANGQGRTERSFACSTTSRTGDHIAPPDRRHCVCPFTEGHVTAEGKLSACCFDATANWTMGDLTKQSFMEAWNAPEFVKLRSAHLKKDVHGTVCENCVAYS